jgi:hypothetical protein
LPDAFVFLKADSHIAAKRMLPGHMIEINEKKAQQALRIEEHRLKKELDPFIEDLHDANPQMYDFTEQDMLIELGANADKEASQFIDYISLIKAFTGGNVPIFELSSNQCFRPVMDTVRQRLAPFLGYVPMS